MRLIVLTGHKLRFREVKWAASGHTALRSQYGAFWSPSHAPCWTSPTCPALIHLFHSWNIFPFTLPHTYAGRYRICFLLRQYIFHFPKQEIKVYGLGSLTGKSPWSQIIDVLTLDHEISSSKEKCSNFTLFPSLWHWQGQPEPSLFSPKPNIWTWTLSFLLLLWPQASPSSALDLSPHRWTMGQRAALIRVIANDLYFAWNWPHI